MPHPRQPLTWTLAFLLSFPGAAWVRLRARQLRRTARPLSPDERVALSPWFDEALLASARVAEADRVPPPLPRWLLRGPLRQLDISWAAGMAFPGVVLVTPPRQAPSRASASGVIPEPRPISISLLFHELVHLVQYDVLGTRGFIRAYIGGWLRAGCRYRDIPLEVEAYHLTDRFEAGERFDVAAEVRSRIDPRPGPG